MPQNPPTIVEPTPGVDPDITRPPVFEIVGIDGVFEGGGALGTAYLGALRAVEDNRLRFRRVAGNSAGAIIAALVAAGFTAREMEALSSAFPAAAPMPDSLTGLGITAPIPFSQFLDLPTPDSISAINRRRTVLWQALNGTVLDVIGAQELDFLRREAAVEACMQSAMQNALLAPTLLISGLDQALRASLREALFFLPESAPRVRDFLPSTVGFRRRLADDMWEVVASIFPMSMMTNLLLEGGLFEGDNFLGFLGELLSRKVHQGDPDQEVRFADLPIPLAVTAFNIDTGKIEIYSSESSTQISVPEAVRRSMSIPFVFEPRGPKGEIVDGGVGSNYPVWLLMKAAARHWPAGSVDHQRLKMGFLVDDTRAARRQQQGVPRFRVTGDPPTVGFPELLSSVVASKLDERGLPPPDIVTILERLLSGGPEMELIEQIFKVTFNGILRSEETTRNIVIPALMSGLPYVEVSTPLLGFHALDFDVNKHGREVRTMWNRAWHETLRELAFAKAKGSLPTAVARAVGVPGDSPFIP